MFLPRLLAVILSRKARKVDDHQNPHRLIVIDGPFTVVFPLTRYRRLGKLALPAHNCSDNRAWSIGTDRAIDAIRGMFAYQEVRVPRFVLVDA